MHTLKELSTIVNNQIQDLYQNREPRGLYNPINYALGTGGKRIRPVLCLMASEMFSGSFEKGLKPAIGLEVFHNFTLLHDDIMDKADIRRNKDTVHTKWDENTAILSGDAMMIEAYEYFFDLEPQLLSKVLPIFNQMAREVCEGQQYDMNFETQADVTEEAYLEMIRLKTAVFLGAALKIGSCIGGANVKESNKLYNLGVELGLAFQLQDDYLDTFGNESVFGKKIGGDIIEGKKTYLLIQALKDNESNRISQIMTDSDIDNEFKIKAVTQVYRDYKVDEITKSKILNHYQRSIEILDSVALEKQQKEVLYDFTDKLKSRIF